MSARSLRLERSRLYLVCGAQPTSFLSAALRGGVDIVQLRMKQARDAEVVATAARFLAICREHAALFILNDRPDLAAAANADGVHVGQDDVAVSEARALLGPDRLVGLSTHTPEQVEAASEAGADYIGVGPLYETPTKPGRPAVGLELVRYAAVNATMPFFAIGGVDPGNLAAVRGAGAGRVAVVRALVRAGDPERVARELRRAFEPDRAGVGAA